MSEYQFIHFLACERPLDDAALEYMERQSTRAEISQWEFTNEYHFGGFRGNATEMLRRGYDVHLHFANFGIRKLMFRLPELPCDKKTFSTFQLEYSLTWTKDNRGKAGILSIEPEADAGTYDYLADVHSMLSRLVPIREMLMQGDLRPFYVAWLACAYGDETIEPPVPAGLGTTNPTLDALAEFYELSPDLLEAAAQQAPAEPKRPDRDAAADRWIRGRTKAELKRIVTDVVTGDVGTVRADLLDKIRQASPSEHWPTAKPSRTLEELREIAESVRAKRVKRETRARDRARKKHLKTEPENWIMAKRKAKKKVLKRSDVQNAANRLRKALGRQTKAVLLDLVVDLASKDRTIMRELEEQFNIELPTEDLVIATRQAIVDATDFDEREMNYNFDYDYDAYATVQKNLKALVGQERFNEAMELSLELMCKGSYQVEMSDEGMMTDDIEDCLRPVIKALKKADIPAKQLFVWCNEMAANDRVGFICDRELAALRDTFRTTGLNSH